MKNFLEAYYKLVTIRQWMLISIAYAVAFAAVAIWKNGASGVAGSLTINTILVIAFWLYLFADYRINKTNKA